MKYVPLFDEHCILCGRRKRRERGCMCRERERERPFLGATQLSAVALYLDIVLCLCDPPCIYIYSHMYAYIYLHIYIYIYAPVYAYTLLYLCVCLTRCSLSDVKIDMSAFCSSSKSVFFVARVSSTLFSCYDVQHQRLFLSFRNCFMVLSVVYAYIYHA